MRPNDPLPAVVSDFARSDDRVAIRSGEALQRASAVDGPASFFYGAFEFRNHLCMLVLWPTWNWNPKNDMRHNAASSATPFDVLLWPAPQVLFEGQLSAKKIREALFQPMSYTDRMVKRTSIAATADTYPDYMCAMKAARAHVDGSATPVLLPDEARLTEELCQQAQTQMETHLMPLLDLPKEDVDVALDRLAKEVREKITRSRARFQQEPRPPPTQASQDESTSGRPQRTKTVPERLGTGDSASVSGGKKHASDDSDAPSGGKGKSGRKERPGSAASRRNDRDRDRASSTRGAHGVGVAHIAQAKSRADEGYRQAQPLPTTTQPQRSLDDAVPSQKIVQQQQRHQQQQSRPSSSSSSLSSPSSSSSSSWPSSSSSSSSSSSPPPHPSSSSSSSSSFPSFAEAVAARRLFSGPPPQQQQQQQQQHQGWPHSNPMPWLLMQELGKEDAEYEERVARRRRREQQERDDRRRKEEDDRYERCRREEEDREERRRREQQDRDDRRRRDEEERDHDEHRAHRRDRLQLLQMQQGSYYQSQQYPFH